MQGNLPIASTNTMSTPSIAQRMSGEKPKRCIWCDSIEHFRRLDCTELQDAIRANRARINDQGCIVAIATGEQLPVMFGKGGMKLFVKLSQPSLSIAVNNITPDDSHGKIGEGQVRITTLDFENGTRTDEIIDVEANEKR